MAKSLQRLYFKRGFEIPGLPGKVYVPERQEESFKKHPCKDCYFCQSCSQGTILTDIDETVTGIKRQHEETRQRDYPQCARHRQCHVQHSTQTPFNDRSGLTIIKASAT